MHLLSDSLCSAASRSARETYLVFGAPRLRDAEIEAVVAVLRSGWIGTGPLVAEFQRRFAEYIGIKHAVAVSSATAALHLSLIASGVGPGDEVITTPMTFCATINAIIHAGATPVLVDCDPKTMNMDAAQLEARVTARTRAILPVHFAGRPCDMQTISNIAVKHSLRIIEDCAHSIEAEIQGRKTGTFGDFGCFSFYVTKNLTTAEGGMIVTNDEDAASRLRTLALHGMSKDAWKRFSDEGYKHYDVVECGFKYNMTDIQAALGLHQLTSLEGNWLRRNRIWSEYQNRLRDLPVKLPTADAPLARHARHLFTVLIDPGVGGLSRDLFISKLHRAKIGVGVHYRSIPEHPYYHNRFGWAPEEYPVAASIGRRTVSLPLSAALTDDDVEDVIAAVRSALQ